MKTQTRRIGAYDYTVTQLDAIRGRRAFVRLTKILGPAIAAGGTKGDSAAFEAFFDHLSEAEMDYFCDLFADVTAVSGGSFDKRAPQLKDIFLTHFAGDYASMMSWLIFCVEVNFSSFFASVGSLFAQLVGGNQASSLPPT